MLKSWMLSFTPRSPACLPLHAYAMRARTPLDVQDSSRLQPAMAEPYRIRKRSAAEIEEERRANVRAEAKRLNLSNSEAAKTLPGAEFMARGRRANSQRQGDRNKEYMAQQRNRARAAEDAAARARHDQLLAGQKALRAQADRDAADRAANAEQVRAATKAHHLQLEVSLAKVPKDLYNMTRAALTLAERCSDTAVETTETAQKAAAAAKRTSALAKELAPAGRVGLIASHQLAECERDSHEQARAARAWAPVSADHRQTLGDQKRGLARLGDCLHEARLKLAADKASM